MLITDKTILERFYSNHRLWQGIPGIARTKKGRTFISLYSGKTDETYGNYAVLLKSDTDSDFGEPIAAVKKDGNFRCFDPVVWIDPLDRLWFIWSVMPGEEVYASICDDPDAEVLLWGKEFYIGRGVMMNKPTVLTTGEWLFPIAFWERDTLPDLRKRGLKDSDKPGSYVYKTSDNGKSFIRLGMADVRNRFCDEHMVIELNNGVLMMLVRTKYGIGVSYSYDRGKNWSVGEDSNLGGPCSRFFISRLRSGRILLINHASSDLRNNLTALLSEDDGKTFPYALLLDERDQVSYPDATECDDGYIYITYDRERGVFKKSLEDAYACAREILTAKITEEDIINGKLMSSGSFLKNVVSKLGHLDPDDPDPYTETSADISDFIDRILCGDEDAIAQVFMRYPIDCSVSVGLDVTKIDALIAQFYKTGSTDRRLLLEIIEMINTPPSNPDPRPTISRIIAYIENHLTEDFCLEKIAQEMNISTFYLSYLFKSVTGIDLLDYRNELRLTKAKHLLIETDEIIDNIAIQCGFSNTSYFIEFFHNSEEISPSQFRKFHTMN